MQDEKDRKPMKLKCGECDHCFDGPLLPMTMTECAKYLKSIRCPSCSADSQRIFAVQQSIVTPWRRNEAPSVGPS